MDKNTRELSKESIEKWILFIMEIYGISRAQCIELINNELIKDK